MGGAGLVAMVAFEVVVFNAVVRFQIWLPSVGDKQTKQVCLAHGFCMVQRVELESAVNMQVRQDCLPYWVCLVQVRRFSWVGNSGKSEQFFVTLESEEDKSVGIVASFAVDLCSLKCKLQRSSKDESTPQTLSYSKLVVVHNQCISNLTNKQF